MTPLFKTTIVIWTDSDTGNISISRLAQEAEDGCAYCSKQTGEWVQNPQEDSDWDDNEFFSEVS